MPNFEPYPSLKALRDEHRILLQQRRSDSDSAAVIEAITTFIQRGTQTGVLLASESDRFDAQNVLDFWENELHHLQRAAPESTLVEYDPSQAPELDDSLSPYVGLDAFNAENRDLFYGRSQLIEVMIEHLQTNRFLAISGPSGSGKSSIAQAGLLPELKQNGIENSNQWHYFPRVVPGFNPLLNLAQALQPKNSSSDWATKLASSLASDPTVLGNAINELSTNTAVLYIDQFEELFTLDVALEVRQAYFDNLLHLLADENKAHRLILTMRSDFETRLAPTEQFQLAYQHAQITVNAMTAKELHEVIVQPANQVGLQFEDGIADQLVRDVLGEPSALPLLQFALLTLWKHRDKNRITWEVYREVGGAQVALAQSADRLFESIGPKAQRALKHIFLQLIRPLPGLEVTRQPVTRQQLHSPEQDNAIIDSVLDELEQANLVHITTRTDSTDDHIEVTHEALVRSWPRLASWLEEARVEQRKRLRLTSMAQQWDALNRDPSALLRGLVLQEAQQYHDLDTLETTFLQASLTEANREAEEAEAERQQELKTVRRNNRRLILLTLLLLFFFGSAMIFAVIARMGLTAAQENAQKAQIAQATAESAQADAEQNANAAATAQAEADTQRSAAIIDRDAAEQSAELAEAAKQDAEIERENAEVAQAEAEANARQSLARELSSQAIAQLESDPTLALLLAVEGAYIPLSASEFVPLEITDALYRALEASQLQRTLPGHANRITAVSILPPTTENNGRILTSSLDGTAKIWDATTGQEIATLRDHAAGIVDLAVNLENNLIATGSDDGLINLYNLDALTLKNQYASDTNSAVKAIALSPTGELLAGAFAGPLVIVWDIVGNNPPYFLFDLQGEVNDLTFSPDGTLLTIAGADGIISIVDAQTGVPIDGQAQLDASGNIIPVSAIAYNPDGTLLAAVLQNNTVRILENQGNGLTQLTTIPGQTRFTSVAFNPKNANLVTGSADNTAKVWNSETGELIYTLSGHNGEVSAVAYSEDGSEIITGSQDSVARLWRTGTGTEPITLSGHNGTLNTISYNNSGTQIATGSDDNSVIVWNPENGAILHKLTRHDGKVNAVTFDPTDQYIATASEDQIVRLFDVQSEEIITVFRHESPVRTLTFSPTGDVLISGGNDGLLKIWDTATQSNLETISIDGPIRDLAYHPTEAVIAVASDTAVFIWDLVDLELQQVIPLENGILTQIAFNHAGNMLATAQNSGIVTLWDYPSNEPLRTLIGHNGSVTDVAFGPNDDILATAGADRTSRIWDLESGANIRIVRGHTGTVTAVSFNPDANELHLATASSDGNAQITPLTQTEALFVQAWALLERPLTTAECLQYHHTEPCITSNIEQASPITP